MKPHDASRLEEVVAAADLETWSMLPFEPRSDLLATSADGNILWRVCFAPGVSARHQVEKELV